MKSSFCGDRWCVDVVVDACGMIQVRDSKYPGGPVHTFTPEEWDAFIKGVKNNEFDLEVLNDPERARALS